MGNTEVGALSHSGAGVRQKSDPGNLEAFGGLDTFQNECKFK